MNTRELQLGNVVKVGERIVKVNSLTQHKIGYCPEPCKERYARSHEVEPVPLTIEGFKKIMSHVSNKYQMDGLPMYYSYEVGVIVYSGAFVCLIKTIHQLQNAYKLLFGEDLYVEI